MSDKHWNRSAKRPDISMFSGSTNGVELGDVLGPKGTPTPGTHWVWPEPGPTSGV